jgi:hypothetical protein
LVELKRVINFGSKLLIHLSEIPEFGMVGNIEISAL